VIGNGLIFFPVADFLKIGGVVKVGTVGPGMTIQALVFISNQPKVFAQLGMPFSRSVTGFTLHVFEIASGIFDHAETGRMAGQAGGIRSFILLG